MSCQNARRTDPRRGRLTVGLQERAPPSLLRSAALRRKKLALVFLPAYLVHNDGEQLAAMVSNSPGDVFIIGVGELIVAERVIRMIVELSTSRKVVRVQLRALVERAGQSFGQRVLEREGVRARRHGTPLDVEDTLRGFEKRLLAPVAVHARVKSRLTTMIRLLLALVPLGLLVAGH